MEKVSVGTNIKNANIEHVELWQSRTSNISNMCSMFGMRTRTSECEHRTFWRLKNGPKIPILAIFFHIYPINFQKYFWKDYRVALFFIFQFPKIFSIFIYNKNWLKCLAKDWKNGQKWEKLAHFAYLKMLEMFAKVRRTLTANFEHLEHVFASHKSNIEHCEHPIIVRTSNIEHCSFQHYQ